MPRKKRMTKRLKDNERPDKEITFNPAFESLGALVKKNRKRKKIGKKSEAENVKKSPEESSIFMEAMKDVRPLSRSGKTIARKPNLDMKPAHPAPDDELEAMAYLSDLVAGNAEMDITFSDEYIEGSVPGFDRKLMKKLRNGHFPIQDYIDLHGMTRQLAKTMVREFLLASYKNGLRCVLIVHGRGLNSENHIPVLKDRLPVWLSRGPVKKIVLAFSTARPYDGGTGAIYILLRKSRII
ncbi:Smr/MutS family protein [Thermodesulfobacteriota bacterium]